MTRLQELIVAAALLAACSCGGNTIEEACPAILIPAVSIRIADAVTGALIARGARMILLDEGTAHADPIGVPDNPGNDSVIVSAGQGPATYDLTVEKPGYETFLMTGIVVQPAAGRAGTECHQPTQVSLLVPLHLTP